MSMEISIAIFEKIRERIFERKSAKEYSKENPRKNLWAKIREKSLEKICVIMSKEKATIYF